MALEVWAGKSSRLITPGYKLNDSGSAAPAWQMTHCIKREGKK